MMLICVWVIKILAPKHCFIVSYKDLDLFELAIDELCHIQTPECLNFSQEVHPRFINGLQYSVESSLDVKTTLKWSLNMMTT